MSGNKNNRETGARKYPAKADVDASDQFSQNAAENRKPAGGMGLTESVNDVNEKTRHADGQMPPRHAKPSPATEKVSGAGPAVAAQAKDAKAGRRPGAYIKDHSR